MLLDVARDGLRRPGRTAGKRLRSHVLLLSLQEVSAELDASGIPLQTYSVEIIWTTGGWSKRKLTEITSRQPYGDDGCLQVQKHRNRIETFLYLININKIYNIIYNRIYNSIYTVRGEGGGGRKLCPNISLRILAYRLKYSNKNSTWDFSWLQYIIYNM